MFSLCTSHLYPRPLQGLGIAGSSIFQFLKPCLKPCCVRTIPLGDSNDWCITNKVNCLYSFQFQHLNSIYEFNKSNEMNYGDVESSFAVHLTKLELGQYRVFYSMSWYLTSRSNVCLCFLPRLINWSLISDSI